MSKIKRLKKNFVIVIGFNILLLVVSLGLSLLLPKYLPKEEYGIYRLLTFYINYSSFIHLGFLDGVYLFFGGKNIFELDKKENSKIFSTFLIFQLIAGIVFLIGLTLVLQTSVNKDIYMLIVVDMVLMNLIYFYHNISQLNEKFLLYSVVFILTKLVVLISLIPLTSMGFNTGKTFIIVNIVVNTSIILFYYLKYVKQIQFRFKFIKIETMKQILNIGFPIFLSTFVGFLIMGIDRFVVDAFFTNTAFAEYSFAVSLIGMFIIFITAITRLLFPYIKLLKVENILQSKYILGIGLIIIFALAISAYYPLVFFVNWFLPDYTDSLMVVFILLPLLIFKAEIDISISNVYKAKLLRKKYFQVNVASFIVAVLVFIIALAIKRDLQTIAFASTISYGIWYFISDIYLHVKLSKGGYDKYILLVLILVGYFAIGYSDFSLIVQFIAYVLYVIVLSGIYIVVDLKKIKKTIQIVKEDLSN